MRAVRNSAMLALVLAGAACATTGAPGDTSAPTPGVGGTGTQGDTTALIPAGLGTLRQEDIAIRFSSRGVQVRAFPLDESIIRVLAPDSYRSLHDLVESRRDEIDAIAARRGVRRPSVWYVSFFGIEPDARFSPMELVITSAGRDYRPLEILPLSPGFGENRLRQRETQTAIYVFEESVDPEQPLVLSLEGVRNASWQDIIRRIERERALVRSRAVPRSTPPPAA